MAIILLLLLSSLFPLVLMNTTHNELHATRLPSSLQQRWQNSRGHLYGYAKKLKNLWKRVGIG